MNRIALALLLVILVAPFADARARRSSDTRFPEGAPVPDNWQDYRRVQGYVIDHVVPLKRGGADSSGNMQWQTKAAKAKDRIE